MEHKLSKAQFEAKTYIETHNLEKVIGDMLNALVLAKDISPMSFMIKYLANLTSQEDLEEHGISIGSASSLKLEQKQIERKIVEIPSNPKEEVKNEVLEPPMSAVEEPVKDFPVFPEGSKALVITHLTRPIWEKYAKAKTSLGHDLYECISLALQKTESKIGIYAADGESYEVYKEVFLPVVEEFQKWHAGTEQVHINPDNFSFKNLDETGDFVKSVVLSIDRNLLGYSFPVALTSEERFMTQKKVQEILDPYVDTSFTKADDSRIEEVAPALLENFHDEFNGTEICRDWPDGRGFFITDGLLATVNLENHLQISSRLSNGDVQLAWEKVGKLAQSLKNRFEFSKDFGYLTSSPELVGTGLKICISVCAPEVLREHSKEFTFSNVGSRVTGDVVEFFNVNTIGMSEGEIVTAVYEAAKWLVKEEEGIRMRIEAKAGENSEGHKENEAKEEEGKEDEAKKVEENLAEEHKAPEVKQDDVKVEENVPETTENE